MPEALEASVQPFVRVIVPLGKSKTYTGIIVRLHDQRPEGVELKAIVSVVDHSPVLLPYQYRLWQWIADYYLCPIGDVYKAALPNGLKQEDGYRPKTETYIRLTKPYRNEQSLHVALNMLVRAPRQQEVFTTYLTLSGWDNPPSDPSLLQDWGNPITREELTNTARCSAAMVKAVIDRGFLETYDVAIGRLNTTGRPHPELIKPLTPAQQNAYDEITSTPTGANGDRPALLWGVTGSGKTEVYIHLIQQAIDEGRQVLYLLPEIALTVQIMQRLHSVFGDRLGIYHSRYSDAERVEIWQKQLSDHPYDVILGVRSSVFLPFHRLGLIIIDEEHEPSFKQQDPAPRYHARSVAMLMSRMIYPKGEDSIRIVLGTATPCLETFHNAMTGKYRLVQLQQRYQGVQLPKVEIIDTADLYRRKMMVGPFSPTLLHAIRSALTAGKQVILFQNRRGFAPMVECRNCGYVPRCQNCDVTLTVHKVTNQLTCHYCGYTYQIPQQCPCCEQRDMRVRGLGTEKIEEELQRILVDEHWGEDSATPLQLRIARMDLDTTRTKNAYERIINDFSAGKTNVLIGTQMVSKGLDFGNVAVVGIVSADTMLNYPDFRAYEHAFQMMSQVAGRAGRRGDQGLVILQTRNATLPVISQVAENDVRGFFDGQLQERQLFRYPPYTRLIYVYLRHTKDPLVDGAAMEMAGRLRQYFGSRVLGPDKPSISRVKSLNIRKIVLKLEPTLPRTTVRQCLRLVRDAVLADKRYASLQVYYDVDPQ